MTNLYLDKRLFIIYNKISKQINVNLQNTQTIESLICMHRTKFGVLTMQPKKRDNKEATL